MGIEIVLLKMFIIKTTKKLIFFWIYLTKKRFIPQLYLSKNDQKKINCIFVLKWLKVRIKREQNRTFDNIKSKNWCLGTKTEKIKY